MVEESKLVHRVISELRAQKESSPFKPTVDIDLVWIVSAPGTVKSVSNEGIYKGRSADLEVVNYGVELVKQVTSVKTQKKEDLVSKEDIEQNGPILYYNGESAKTKNYVFPQNEDFAEMTLEPDFPIPQSRIQVRDIEELGTHTQVKEIAEFLRSNKAIKKVAVVGLVHHSRRIARYLEKYKGLFPEDVVFVSAPVPETRNPIGATLREVRKIKKYAKKGDLTEEPYF